MSFNKLYGKTFEFQSVYFDSPIVPQRVLDIFMPETVTEEISIFFVHGGGWSGGSRTIYHQIMRAFNREGFICASTDYRLMSEGVNVLTQIEDIRHGYLLFLQYLRSIKRPLRVFTHGSSAGAHLTALLSFAGPGDCGEDISHLPKMKWIAPVGTALQATPVKFEPWDDIFPAIWSSMQKIVAVPYEGNRHKYEKIAPDSHVTQKTCPTFFMEAENEHMFPLRYIKDIVGKMNSMGVRAEYKIYANAEHGFFYDVTRRQQKEAFNDILSFLKCQG